MNLSIHYSLPSGNKIVSPPLSYHYFTYFCKSARGLFKHNHEHKKVYSKFNNVS